METTKGHAGRARTLEGIGGVLLAIGGLCYAVGVLVNGIHLARIGASEVPLLRVANVTSGVLCLAVMAGPGALMEAGRRRRRREGRRSAWVRAWAIGLGAAVAMRGFFAWDAAGVGGWRGIATWAAGAGLILGYSWLLCQTLWLLLEERGKKRRDWSADRTVTRAVAVAVLCVFGVGLYARYGHPLVHAALGGGAPRVVGMLLTEDGAEAGRLGGLEVLEGGRVEGVFLLYESGDAFFVSKGSLVWERQPVVRVPKREVNGVIQERLPRWHWGP